MPQRRDRFVPATPDGYAPQMRTRKVPALPATPPREVLAALDTAAGVLRELEQHELALHVEVDEATVRLEFRDTEGGVVCELLPVYVLDVLAREAGTPTAGGEARALIR
jgi:hypothetical protein